MLEQEEEAASGVYVFVRYETSDYVFPSSPDLLKQNLNGLEWPAKRNLNGQCSGTGSSMQRSLTSPTITSTLTYSSNYLWSTLDLPR